MYRFTTPTVSITVEGADLTHCRVWVTMSQDRAHRITKEITDLKSRVSDTEWTFEVSLTQSESARFRDDRPVGVQVNVMDHNGFRAATNIEHKEMDFTNLMDRTVRNG